MPDRDEVEIAIAWQEYVDRHKAEPTNSDSSDTEAADLYRWMWRIRQMSKENGLAEAAARRLDVLCPSWRAQPSRRTPQREHREFARAYRDFVERTERLPWARSMDERDRELAQWFVGAKQALKSGELSPEIIGAIEEFIPNWTRTRYPFLEHSQYRERDPGRTLANAVKRASAPAYLVALDTVDEDDVLQIERIATFIAVHDRLPELGAAGTEGGLATWLTRCVAEAGIELGERLDYTFPEWREKYGADAAVPSPERSDEETRDEQESAMTHGTYRPDGGRVLIEYIDSRDELDALDLVVLSTDKAHPGLALDDPNTFARRVLERRSA
ncbi:hypothetical protein [Microbacterium halophytorum]|uniref:hypothetical protein n=1 Tax=Microbacterium halophytorum TaxID=2067568 RepID=UPI001319EAA5|nr:hypothetical protein [Microbacterium halophytorum]